MTLRARLLIVVGLLLVTVAVGGVAVWKIDRDAQIDQLDRRLEATLPGLLRFAAPPAVPMAAAVPARGGGVPPAPDDGRLDPFSEIYVALVDTDGSREVVAQPSAIDDPAAGPDSGPERRPARPGSTQPTDRRRRPTTGDGR